MAFRITRKLPDGVKIELKPILAFVFDALMASNEPLNSAELLEVCGLEVTGEDENTSVRNIICGLRKAMKGKTTFTVASIYGEGYFINKTKA